MSARRTILVLTMGLLAASGVRVAAADAPVATDDIRQEMQSLQARMVSLESKLAEREHLIPPTGSEGIPQFIPGVNMSGFVDVSYTYSMNEPRSGANTYRVFDTRSNGFMINNAQLNLSKPVSEESPVGFTTELMFGTDAEVIGAVTTGLGALAGTGNTNEVELQEAFVEALLPLGCGLNMRFGKMATLAGAEVIESINNWTISRSMLFGYAEPATHTGIRFMYPFTDTFSATLGVNNGWDLVDDTNKAKTIESQLAWKPTSNFSLAVNQIFGAEQANNNNNHRYLFDLVAWWQPTEQLELMLNYDWAKEDDAVGLTNTPPTIGKDGQWSGIAAYARWWLNKEWALFGRWEWFRDYDATRHGLGAAFGDVDVLAYTLGTQWKWKDKLVTRLEYRHDDADENIYTRDTGATNYQDTLMAELIYPF